MIEHITLAPLEGCMDARVRELLTNFGGIDLCIVEFLRVTNTLHSVRTFKQLCPELNNDGYTLAGTPARIQLLGSDEPWLAENAIRAIELGSHGVDFNLGCPSKCVNSKGGGALLLKDPEIIYRCVSAMRQGLGNTPTLSCKIRLGWDDSSRLFEIVDAIASAGADQLAIHARTKRDGYNAKAIRWDKIAEVTQYTRLPITANGEIWNREDAIQCSLVSQCRHIMIGRGAMTVPNLAASIKYNTPLLPWPDLLAMLLQYGAMEVPGSRDKYFQSRVKQWFIYFKQHYPEANSLFQSLRLLKGHEAIFAHLEAAYAHYSTRNTA